MTPEGGRNCTIADAMTFYLGGTVLKDGKRYFSTSTQVKSSKLVKLVKLIRTMCSIAHSSCLVQ